MQGSFSFIKTCAFRKSYPDIMVVQPGQDRDGYNDPGPLHCFRRNVFQPCDGDPPFTMYFETVDWATSKPSISSSPWIRDAPHLWFSLLIRRMRSRNSRAIFGRPARCRDFQRQNAVKPARCQRRMVSG